MHLLKVNALFCKNDNSIFNFTSSWVYKMHRVHLHCKEEKTHFFIYWGVVALKLSCVNVAIKSHWERKTIAACSEISNLLNGKTRFKLENHETEEVITFKKKVWNAQKGHLSDTGAALSLHKSKTVAGDNCSSRFFDSASQIFNEKNHELKRIGTENSKRFSAQVAKSVSEICRPSPP